MHTDPGAVVRLIVEDDLLTEEEKQQAIDVYLQLHKEAAHRYILGKNADSPGA